MPPRHDIQQDKNFDDLAHHFKRNIYGELKGEIRLRVIERDLAPYLDRPKTIVDAGGGQGQLAISLAQAGHDVKLCDISTQMLALATAEAAQLNMGSFIRFINCPIQDLPRHIDQPVDMVLCHAVLEWMAYPEQAFAPINRILAPGGLLSLAFFNVNSIIYKNLLRSNFKKIRTEDYVGDAGSLTPISPLAFDTVQNWCVEHGFTILKYSGIRVFSDYILDQVTRHRHPQELKEMELKFSEIDPFRMLGRYIHLVALKQ